MLRISFLKEEILLLLVALLVPIQSTADWGYSRKLLNETPCNVANIIDAMANADVPEKLDEIENRSDFYKVDESESIFHNFREGVLSEQSSYEEVSRAMGRATAEYWMEKLGLMDRSEWTTLDPKMPNVKYVGVDGLKEAVYNKETRKLVNSGINAGTANAASNSLQLEHWYSNYGGDIGRFSRCKTPGERHKAMAKYLLEHPELISEVLTRETFHVPTQIPEMQCPAEVKAPTEQCVDARQINLNSLDFDDESYDWCKCASPGCVECSLTEVNFYITFVCSKCGKVNRSYAKRAVEMERKAKEKGIPTLWFGDKAEEKAKSAL